MGFWKSLFSMEEEVKEERKEDSPQNDIEEIKDGLPLVNQDLLTKQSLEIYQINGYTDYEIGDEIIIDIDSSETNDGFKVESTNDKKKTMKLCKNGTIIKAKIK